MATAAASRRRAPLHPNAEPNVIPFIDVLLVLLIIFMVTAPKPTTDLRLDLAAAGPTRPVFIPPTIVELREDGLGYRLFVSGVETTLSRLGDTTLQHILAANQELTTNDVFREGRVYIRADLDVAYANVVAVTDTLQGEGFEKVSIAAQDADAE